MNIKNFAINWQLLEKIFCPIPEERDKNYKK